MGHYDQYIIDHLQGLDALLLESNHDVNMLQAGPYPYYLKRRILGDHGHLSNENAGRLLCCILHDNLKRILLGHLSKENNYEELAYETVKLEITDGDNPFKAVSYTHLDVYKRQIQLSRKTLKSMERRCFHLLFNYNGIIELKWGEKNEY